MTIALEVGGPSGRWAWWWLPIGWLRPGRRTTWRDPDRWELGMRDRAGLRPDGLAETKEILEQSRNPDGSAVQVLLIHERSRPGKASRWREETRRDTTEQDTSTRAGGFLTLICSHH